MARTVVLPQSLTQHALTASQAKNITPAQRATLDGLFHGDAVDRDMALDAIFAVAITNATRLGQSSARRSANNGVQALWAWCFKCYSGDDESGSAPRPAKRVVLEADEGPAVMPQPRPVATTKIAGDTLVAAYVSTLLTAEQRALVGAYRQGVEDRARNA